MRIEYYLGIVISMLHSLYIWIKEQSQKKCVKIVFELLAFTFIIYLVYSNLAGLKLIFQTIKINYLYLFCAFIFVFFITFLIGTSSWLFINKGFGQTCTWFQAARVQLLSTVAKYIPGFTWQYVSKAYLSKENGSTNKAIVIGLAYEFIQTLWIGICFALIFIPEKFNSIGFLQLGNKWIHLGGWGGLILSVSSPFWGEWLMLKFLGKNNKVYKRYLIIAIFLIIIGWCLNSVALWLTGYSLMPDKSISIETYFFGISSALVAGILAIPVPNGIGVREGVMVAVLGPYLTTPLSLVLAGLSRIEITFSELFSALIINLAYRIKGREKDGK